MTGTKKQTNVLIMTIAVFIATFMTAIEGTIVSTAMPTIVGSLHGVKLMNWVFSIYLLTSAMTTPIFGKMADRIGRKPVMLLGLGVFVVGSLLSGLSQSMIVLIIMRAIQGIGAGAIMPVTFTIIADMYPVEQRARILGLNGSAWGIAAVIAPLLGGFIVDQLSWHWVFVINVPIGLLTMLLTIIFMHEDYVKQNSPVDYLGSGLLALALMFILIAFQSLSGAHGLVRFIILLVVAGVLLVFFMRREKRAADPVISPDLFKLRTFMIQNIIAALISGVVMATEVYMPMWMQGILGLSASLGGFVVTPSSVVWILGSFIAGPMLVRMRPQRVLVIALLVVLAGLGIMLMLPAYAPYWNFLFVSGLLGLGFGIIITATTVTSQSAVDNSQVGVATSFNTLSRTLGQTLMVSIFGIIFNMTVANVHRYGKGLTTDMLNTLVNPQTAGQLPHQALAPLREALFAAFRGVFISCAVIVILGFVINLFDAKRKPAKD